MLAQHVSITTVTEMYNDDDEEHEYLQVIIEDMKNKRMHMLSIFKSCNIVHIYL